MTDIVERARFMRYRGKDAYLNQMRDFVQEMADEIERLRAALQQIAQDDTEGVGVFQVIARRALEHKP